MTNTVIFAIDNNTDLHTVAKFMRHMDTAKAMHTLRGMFVQCIGMYNGELEVSYMMEATDFIRLVKHTDYVKDQESVLYVPSNVKQPCSLVYTEGDYTVSLPPMRQVSSAEAMRCNSWTYVPQTNKYFTTEKV